ncbi:SDR family NAD(P)-dependent oxidoreductase [Mycolicibacterium litorale]|uniref:SDR family NAD(P)-dependent oxidoreductase n=1 Tax=Mycolicibacterium litorale TaxID=758802 RepID=UPI003CF26468
MPSVLITGASRGIGHAVAARLATRGWHVVAGVRTDSDAARMADMHPGVAPVLLDVTNPEHLAALDRSLPNRLDAVVNNAGIVVGGPLEAVTADRLRHQLDTNVVAQLAVTQAVLPRLRTSNGRIVFVSSALGRVAAPMIGAYCASKAALEAAADTLRMELRAWRIPVVIVEPGQTDTDMWRTARSQVDEAVAAMSPTMRELYGRHLTGFTESIPTMQKAAVDPGMVADVVEKALTARRPRARYAVGIRLKLQLALVASLPVGVRDRLLCATSRQPCQPVLLLR